MLLYYYSTGEQGFSKAQGKDLKPWTAENTSIFNTRNIKRKSLLAAVKEAFDEWFVYVNSYHLKVDTISVSFL